MVGRGMEFKGWGSWTLCAIASVAAAACGVDSMACTTIGCGPSNMVSIRFEPSLALAGDYTLATVVDGEAGRCQFGFDPRVRERASEGDCDGLDLRGSNVPIGHDAITEGAPYRIVGLSVPIGDLVSIRLERDGAVLIDHEFEPQIVGVEINGPGCGECPMAIETVPVVVGDTNR